MWPSTFNFLFIFNTDMGMKFRKIKNILHSLYFFSVDMKILQGPLNNQILFVTLKSMTREGLKETRLDTTACFGYLHNNTL